MRKIRNQQNNIADPALMFARGVESLVGDHLHNPSQSDVRERKEMRRKPVRREARGSFFNVLLKQFSF